MPNAEDCRIPYRQAERQKAAFFQQTDSYTLEDHGISVAHEATCPMANDLDPLRMLTLAEAAELMHVSKRTLSRMIDRKEFPAFKVGGQWRVRKANSPNGSKASTSSNSTIDLTNLLSVSFRSK